MNRLVKAWLDLPISHRSYKEGLKIFSRLAGSTYPTVVQQLNYGPRGQNPAMLEQYMHLIKDLPNDTSIKLETTKKVITEKQAIKQEEKTNAAHFSEALQTKKTLLHKRMQTSQSFHDCETDEQRALVCDQIDEINLSLEAIDKAITQFKQTGEFPKQESSGTLNLPDTDAELRVLQNRAVVMKNGTAKKIELINTLAANDPQRNKLGELEEKFRAATIRYNLIKAKREELKKKNGA